MKGPGQLCLLLACFLKVSSVHGAEYISYMIDGLPRRCIPIKDCPPGKEILPCKEEFTEDQCRPCLSGMVQPNYISSSSDINSTKCFKPLGSCSAHDVIDSRTSNTNSCEFHKYCQCKTTDCYYGDPCTCKKRDKCKAGMTMNKSGECVECPSDTAKDEEGCGPCKSINQDKKESTFAPVALKIKPDKNDTKPSETDQNNYQPTGSNLHTDLTINIEVTQEPLARKEVVIMEAPQNTLMTVVVILSVVMVLGTITLIFLIVRWKRHKHDPEVAVDQVERGQLIEQPLDENDYQDHLANLSVVQNVNQCGSLENRIISSAEGKPASNQLSTTSTINTSSQSQIASSFQGSVEPRNEGIGNIVTNMTSLPVDIIKIIENSSVIPSSQSDLGYDSQPVNGVFDGDRNRSTDVDYNTFSENLDLPMQGVVHVKSSNSNERMNNLNMPYLSQLDVSGFSKSEVFSSPVTQESHFEQTILQNRGTLPSVHRSPFSNNDDLHCSPMSKTTSEGKYQKYDHLVSASDRNTESIGTNLENFNFNLAGDNRTTVTKHSTTSKFIDSRLHSPVDENSNEM